MAVEKRSLDAQIEEVEHELAMRDKVYPPIVGRMQMRQSEADEHITRMKSVLATLKLFKRHEAAVRALLIALEERRKKEAANAA